MRQIKKPRFRGLTKAYMSIAMKPSLNGVQNLYLFRFDPMTATAEATSNWLRGEANTEILTKN